MSQRIHWRRQGAGVVGPLSLPDGVMGRAVVIGPASNPKGAMLVRPSKETGAPESVSVYDELDCLSPAQVVSILCMQERAFGEHGLPPFDES